MLLTSAPNSPPAVARAQGEPQPAPGPPPREVQAPPPLPRHASPARPPGASPCPAKRAPLPRTRPGPQAPRPGAPRRPGPSLMVPPPRGAPRKDPEGNSRLSAQQPKAGRGSRRAGPGPDNDARGSPRPPTLTPAPHPQPATLKQLPAQPYAPDARHPRPQLPACTREDARQHSPRPPAGPAGGGRLAAGWGRGGSASLPVLRPLPVTPAIPLPPFGWGRLTLRPGEGSATFSLRTPQMGTPPHLPGLCCSSCSHRDLCLHLLRRLFLLPAFFQPKPTHLQFEKGRLKFRKWKFQPPHQGPIPQSPGSCGGPKGLLFSAARLGLGSWDPGAIGLLRCEGADLTSPKVRSILDTPVEDGGQVIGGGGAALLHP